MGDIDAGVATAREILMYLTDVMRGESDEGRSGASTSRMKAAELLGRRLGAFDAPVEAPAGAVIVDDIPPLLPVRRDEHPSPSPADADGIQPLTRDGACPSPSPADADGILPPIRDGAHPSPSPADADGIPPQLPAHHSAHPSQGAAEADDGAG